MSLDSTIALITADEYRTVMDVDADDDNFNVARVETFINQASMFLESECGRRFIAATGRLETFSGADSEFYYPKYWPVTNVTKVEYWDGSNWIDYPDATYPTAINPDANENANSVWFTKGHRFWKGSQNWRITYNYGYAIALVPHDLKLACMLMAKWFMLQQEKLGITSESLGDNSTSYNFRQQPITVSEMIRKYGAVRYG